MSFLSDGRRAPWMSWTAVSAITLLGATLRLYHLGSWPLEGDELNTLRDSLVANSLHSVKPLLFLLNYYVISPWHPLDELGLRILPVIFGIAAVPVMYFLARRALDPAAGMFAALIVAFDPSLVYWSQYARYYSLVFLLSSVVPIAAYVGVRERRVTWIAAGVVCGALSIFAHPSAGLVLVGVGLWVAAISWFDIGKTEGAWRIPRPWVAGIALLLGALVLLRFIPQLREWVALRQDWGHVGGGLLLSYVDHVSIAGVGFAIAGVIWLWLLKRRVLATLILAVIGVPVLGLTVLSYWMSVSTAYLLATVPAVVVAVSAFLAETLRYGPSRGTSRVVTGACVFALLGSEAPALVSQYRDGGRADFRTAARELRGHLVAGDRIVSDQPKALGHYLGFGSVDYFPRDPAALSAARAGVAQGGALWIVERVFHRGGFREVDLGDATAWIRHHCTLSGTYGVWRLDYKHNALNVYRCPAP